MKINSIKATLGAGLLATVMGCTTETKQKVERPNIIWLMSEDISLDLECYGMKGVRTPNLNKMAEEGVLFTNCYCSNPICSPSRSAMMTGVHQNRINAQHHRSNRNKPLPEGFKPITSYLRDAGYTCLLGHSKVMHKGRKTDCNFKHKAIGAYDGKENFGLFDKFGETFPVDTPFFSQITLFVTHRGDWWDRISGESKHPVDPKTIELPPYMADDPVIRKDWAKYLDQIEYMDNEVGMLMKELEEKGLADNTIIFFIGDNGRCNVRGKGYLNDPGVHIPLIIHWPKGLKGGQINDGVVSTTDISATILKLAGAEMPDYLTGEPFIQSDLSREYSYSARDLWDEVLEKSRSVSSKQYKYIRHYKPEVPFDAHQAYLEFYRPAVHVMRRLKKEGKLSAEEMLFFADHKEMEELYDLKADPHELKNLAKDANYKEVLEKMRNELDDFREKYETHGIPVDTTTWQIPASVPVLKWIKKEKPELYKEMESGKEIGFGKMVREYRKTHKKK